MEPGPFVHSVPPEEEMLMRLRSSQSGPLDPETLASTLRPVSALKEVIGLIPPAFCEKGLLLCLPSQSEPEKGSTVHLPSPMRILHSRNHHRPYSQTQ